LNNKKAGNQSCNT